MSRGGCLRARLYQSATISRPGPRSKQERLWPIPAAALDRSNLARCYADRLIAAVERMTRAIIRVLRYDRLKEHFECSSCENMPDIFAAISGRCWTRSIGSLATCGGCAIMCGGLGRARTRTQARGTKPSTFT